MSQIFLPGLIVFGRFRNNQIVGVAVKRGNEIEAPMVGGLLSALRVFFP
jgi:hypothetical protein